MFKRIKEPADSFAMQLDLNNCLTGVKLSTCCLIKTNLCIYIFGVILRTSPDTDTGVQDYYIDGTKIAFHNSTKDLGLILSNNLDWTDHYHNITAKAYKVLGLLRHSFKTDSTDAKRKLYISLVKSHLLYCSQIWQPHKIKDILLFERVQRRATKYILNDSTSS